MRSENALLTKRGFALCVIIIHVHMTAIIWLDNHRAKVRELSNINLLN